MYEGICSYKYRLLCASYMHVYMCVYLQEQVHMQHVIIIMCCLCTFSRKSDLYLVALLCIMLFFCKNMCLQIVMCFIYTCSCKNLYTYIYEYICIHITGKSAARELLWNFVCFSVLQCVLACCSVLQCVITAQARVLQQFLCGVWRVVVCCGVLQCVAVCCSVLQCVAV